MTDVPERKAEALEWMCVGCGSPPPFECNCATNLAHFNRDIKFKAAVSKEYADKHVRADILAARDAELAEARAEVERLREALKPFADEAVWWFTRNYGASDSPVEGFDGYEAVMTCGDLFNARAVLSQGEA